MAAKKTIDILKQVIEDKILLLAIVLSICAVIFVPYFNSLYNYGNLLTQMAIYGTIAVGMTFAIICGEFDLSVGSVLSFASLLTVGLEPRIGLLAAAGLAIAICCGIGLINGLLVSRAGISSFVVTFGAMVYVKGMALSFSDGRPITCRNEAFNTFGDLRLAHVPVAFLIFIVLLTVSHYVLRYTRFGRNIYAVGGNREVARTTGIPVALPKTAVFVLTGFFAGLMGVLLAARLNSGSAVVGDGMELTVIACVVIGGTHLAGGRGSMLRTLLGVFILGLIKDVFDLLAVYPYLQSVIYGTILIVVVAWDGYNKKNSVR